MLKDFKFSDFDSSRDTKMTPLIRRPQNYVINSKNKSQQLQIVKTICLAILIMVVTIFLMRLGSPKAPPINPNDPPSQPGVLKLSEPSIEEQATKNIHKVEGTPSSYKELDLTDLKNISGIEELHLKYVEIDPEEFSTVLNSPNFQTLKVITMERIKIPEGKPWNFHRASLPHLEQFIVDLDIGFHDQYTDYMKEITQEHLISLLFYDKNTLPTILGDLGEKIVSDQVEITLRYDGWTVLCINRNSNKATDWEVILGVEFADKVLQTLNQKNMNIVHLTMTECLVSLTSFPKSLQYLNLYRVTIIDGDIVDYFKTQSLITELYIELRNSTLKLSQIPKSVKTLAIGDVIEAKYEVGDTVEAETVGLGFPLDVAIINNFDKIFTNVRNVGVFEPTDGVQHSLLKNILNANYVNWLLMEGFERRVNSSSKTEVEQEMEHYLENCGVPPTERNFLLFKDSRTYSWFEMDLNKAQKLKFRYDILGWNEYINWEMYSANF